jgi:hypothetical protein
MRQFHFYDASTGVLHASSIVINAPDAEKNAAANCPPDHEVVEGTLDPLSQCVDVATGQVIDYQPPAPSSDHIWSTDSKRWQLSGAAQGKLDARSHAVDRIAALEASQHRVMRELALGSATALARLKSIDAEIVALRPALAP